MSPWLAPRQSKSGALQLDPLKFSHRLINNDDSKMTYDLLLVPIMHAPVRAAASTVHLALPLPAPHAFLFLELHIHPRTTIFFTAEKK